MKFIDVSVVVVAGRNLGLVKKILTQKLRGIKFINQCWTAIHRIMTFTLSWLGWQRRRMRPI